MALSFESRDGVEDKSCDLPRGRSVSSGRLTVTSDFVADDMRWMLEDREHFLLSPLARVHDGHNRAGLAPQRSHVAATAARICWAGD